MREMDLDMMQLVVTITRATRKRLDITAARTGRALSDVVRDALDDAYGDVELSDEDWREINADIEEAYKKRLEIREDRKRGVKRPNGRPPGSQLPGGRRKRPAPEAARHGTEGAKGTAPEAARHGTGNRAGSGAAQN